MIPLIDIFEHLSDRNESLVGKELMFHAECGFSGIKSLVREFSLAMAKVQSALGNITTFEFSVKYSPQPRKAPAFASTLPLTSLITSGLAAILIRETRELMSSLSTSGDPSLPKYHCDNFLGKCSVNRKLL